MKPVLIPVIEFTAQYMSDNFTLSQKKVKAERYFIPQLNNFSFAIHKDLKYRTEWVISETSTGLEFCRSIKKKDIQTAINHRLKQYTINQITEIIKNHLT